MRTIESPGVEVSEIDLSLRAATPTGTSVLIGGFASRGPTDEPIQVTTLSEFEQIYGVPNTPAERYFYHSARSLFNSPANILTYRLPYGADNGIGYNTGYSALLYPLRAVSLSAENFGTVLPDLSSQVDEVLYLVGEPTHLEISSDEYQAALGGAYQFKPYFHGSFGEIEDIEASGIVVLNKAQSTINTNFEGYYVGMIDNTNLTPSTNFDGLLDVKTIQEKADATNDYLTIPSTRLNFSLSAVSDANSVTFGQDNDSLSEVMENLSKFDVSTEDYDDTLSFGLFKIRQSIYATDTIVLDYVLSEKYVSSLDYHRTINSETGGPAKSFFLETAEEQSPNVVIMVNDYISKKNGTTWLDINGKPKNKVRMMTRKFADTTYMSLVSAKLGCTTAANLTAMQSAINSVSAQIGVADSLYGLGSYESTDLRTKDIGSIPAKLDRMLETVSNVELFNIDLVVDGGVSTINAVAEYIENTTGTKYFDDTVNISLSGLSVSDPAQLTGEALTFRDNWKTVFDRYANFCQFARKDCMFIADLPRNIFIQGRTVKTMDGDEANFSQTIYNPIRNMVATVNTNYATTYTNWVKVYDTVLDDQTWVPFSGFAATITANTDATFQPWYAPAGFTRGLITGVNDIAIYPTQKQRDQLYRIATNPIAFFPNEGFVIYGQKTLQKKPSAFDRINVRRLFLNLEKAVRDTVKYFVFEPNTLLTRTRVINTLSPIFENAKNTEGVYDYMIVCDERNNTPEVIDNNELKVDIYLKPVRAAEFILVTFYATRTDANFDELVG